MSQKQLKNLQQTKDNATLFKWKDVPRLPLQDALDYLYMNFDKVNSEITNNETVYHLVSGNSELRIKADNDQQMIKKACDFLENFFPNTTVFDTDVKKIFE